ncbi:MAG: hypothetical protein H6621_01840 [Halobacteriovoraceae bacterium]|nr:hypothetical protein [Halobacteriovoraceae bacterium]
MTKFILSLFISLYASWAMTQDLAINISGPLFNKILKKIIQKELVDKEFKGSLKKNIAFDVKNITLQNPTKVEPHNFLSVYGKHLLMMDFQRPFGIDVSLENINYESQLDSANVKLGVSKKENNRTLYPFSLQINLAKAQINIGQSSVTEKGLTLNNTRLLQQLEEELQGLKDSGHSSYNEQVNKQLFERYALLECLKLSQSESQENIQFTAKDHRVTIEGLIVDAQGTLAIEPDGKDFQVKIEDLKLQDNLTPQNFDQIVQMDLQGKQFSINDVVVATYGLDAQDNLEIRCHELEGSQSGLQKKLFDETIIPKIKEKLAMDIDRLLEEKLIPKLSVDISKKSFSLKREFEKEMALIDLLKEDKTKKEEKKQKFVKEVLKKNIEKMKATARIEQIDINPEKSISILLNSDLEIDGNRIECNDGYYLSCRYFNSNVEKIKKSTSDFGLQVNGKLIANIINEVDQYFSEEVFKKIPYLVDREGHSVLSLDSHDLIVVPVKENTLDVVANINIETSKLKKIFQLLLANDYQIQKPFKKITRKICEILQRTNPYNLYLFPQCWHLLTESHDEYDEVLNLALELRLKIFKEEDIYKLKVMLPEAKKLFSSQYVESSWREHYLLRMLYSLMNEKKWEINLDKRFGKMTLFEYKGLYEYSLKKILGKNSELLQKEDNVYYLEFELFNENIEQGIEIKKLGLSDKGHLNLNLKFQNIDQFIEKIKIRKEKSE